MSNASRTTSLEERQLKPIYEALDTGNVKSALTHCNKLLKKYPSPPAPGTAATTSPTTVPRQLLTALKSLALVRANKLDEASTLTNNLLAETPTDETVLTTLAHSLKPLDRPKELVGMWVGAWGRASKEVEEAKKKMAKGGKGAKTALSGAELDKLLQHSEELGAQAFMAMVRTGHWAMAQSTAFKLYRTFAPPKGQENLNGQAPQSLRYLYWSTMAAIMQSEYPSPPPPVPVLVMIPPPTQVREWEEAKKKEEEEDKRLLAAEQAQANGNGLVASTKVSPTRRKKRALALSLAQRLIEMTVDSKDGDLLGEEAVLRGMSVERFWLWGEVMRRVAQISEEDNVPSSSEKWSQAHKLMSSSLASRAAGSSLHVEELRSEIAKKAEDWKRECEGMGLRLGRGDRNWKTFTVFLDTLFHFLPNSSETPDMDAYPCVIKRKVSTTVVKGITTTKENDEKTEAPDADAAAAEAEADVAPEKLPLTVGNTRVFLKGLADGDEVAHPGRERASHLGVLELERRLRKYPNLRGDASPDYVALMKDYFNNFKFKAVVVEDLLPYVLELEAGSEERSQWDAFLAGLEQQTNNVDNLQVTINVLKLQRLITAGTSCTVESELAYAKTCATLYHAALPLGKDLVSTDLQPADDLAVLAATAMLTAYHLAVQDPSTEATESCLLDAITFLEFASQKSRWAYPPRFLLVRLYRLLGAPALSSQHYGMANLKSIQFDTLAHHILTRASTFSLGCVGDLSYVNECVESSQIYHVSGTETADQLVKAFQYERYSQVAEFVLLDEKIENSFQRDLTKLEHFRMKNLHEGLTPESVEVELVELRFVWGRAHHDNRDLDLLPSYQPTGLPSIDSLTSIGGAPVTKQWFNTILKMWVLILHQASEQLWTEDEQANAMVKLSTFDEESIEQLTAPEQLLVKFSRAMMDWLAPHHVPIKHAVMLNAVTTLAAAKAKHAASTSASSTTSPATSNPRASSGRKANGLSNGTEGTAASNVGDGAIGVKVGDVKIITGMLTLHEPMDVPPPPKDLGVAIKEPPAELTELLDEFQKMFDETLARPSSLPWEQLHIAQIVHEAVYIMHLLTARFALGSGKKKAHPTFKPLRAKAIALLNHAAKAISKIGEDEITPNVRKQWLATRRGSGILDEVSLRHPSEMGFRVTNALSFLPSSIRNVFSSKLTDENILSVGRNYMESKKKTFEQLGKGLTKAQQSIAKAAAGVPPGS